jgi:hypothetical protein
MVMAVGREVVVVVVAVLVGDDDGRDNRRVLACNQWRPAVCDEWVAVVRQQQSEC